MRALLNSRFLVWATLIGAASSFTQVVGPFRRPPSKTLGDCVPPFSSLREHSITSKILASKSNDNENDEEEDKNIHNDFPQSASSSLSENNGGQGPSNNPNNAKSDEDKEKRKSQVAKAASQIIKREEEEEKSGLLEKLNPFQAGKNFRKSLDSALRSFSGDRQRSPYYLDDRFQEGGGALFAQETNPYLARLEQEDYVPEVLVVGATGEVGRLVVRRLILEGRSRVRVLVRDLYSKTLNMLGTGVVYCQGDLNNMDSLEYALTDVDKIVVCAAAPRPDEDRFQEKFLGFAKDNLDSNTADLGKIESSTQRSGVIKEDGTEADMEWERLESVLKVRARLAEQVDYIGMQNLVKAYQNVRHADYGTSQAAKRSLFKFQNRPEDFNLFAIDDSDSGETLPAGAGARVGRENIINSSSTSKSELQPKKASQSFAYPSSDDAAGMYSENIDDEDKYPDVYDQYADEYDKYASDYDAYDALDSTDVSENRNTLVEKSQDLSVKTQVQWIRNEFGHGVFVGKVPKGGEAAIISIRLRSRGGSPDEGINLSAGFGGFVCRVCADGGVYEAFIRTSLYDEQGIEFVANFTTASKGPRRGNASRNKFATVRLPFESFRPLKRRNIVGDIKPGATTTFDGSDVRHIGFRFRSSLNSGDNRSKRRDGDRKSFYIALSYLKLYRVQPEPEFVFLSDARIPPILADGQVRHDLRQLVPAEALSASENGAFQILDDKMLQQMSNKMSRSPEETYYKFLGEEVLKNSGLR